ncbi:tryptophan synthase subunit alpha [Streptomyces sp. SYSU K217416]
MTTELRPPSWAAARLDHAFARSRARGHALLAAYLPVGYPTFDQSLDTLHVLAKHADVLELGLPFTDPMMDGPVVAAAAAQSLAAGFRIRHLFLAVRELSATSSADLLVMTYWQPVYRYGPQRFAAELAAAGAAGVILPDLPVEEASPWLAASSAHGLHTVFVTAPNASDARLSRVCAAASGMVYAPAVAGVTGATGPLHSGLRDFVNRLRALSSLPVGVGIGVSTAEMASEVAEYADAVIVGSAIIRRLGSAPGARGTAAAAALAAELADGIRRSTTRAA